MMNRWTKVVILIAFHGLMMTDYYYWEQAKISIQTFKAAGPVMGLLREEALHQVNLLGGVLVANVALIAVLVILLCLRKKK